MRKAFQLVLYNFEYYDPKGGTAASIKSNRAKTRKGRYKMGIGYSELFFKSYLGRERMLRMFNSKRPSSRLYRSIALDKTSELITFLIEKLGAIKLIEEGTSQRDDDTLYFQYRQDELIVLEHHLRSASINCWLYNDVYEQFQRDLKPFLKTITEGNELQLYDGDGTTSLGIICKDLRKINYSERTNSQLSHVQDCLNSPVPCGRIVLFEGPPGTGKSYAIQALISNTQNANFIYIPSNLVSALSSRSGLHTFLVRNKKTILIMEDADNNLRRKNGDMNNLSTILNTGDGLLGELTDVRIIATTNTSAVNLDEAITRPGRLCSHIEFSKLTQEQAQRALVGLTEKPVNLTKPTYALSELYMLAYNEKWKERNRTKKQQDMGNYV